MGTQQFGLIDNWLRNIKDVYRLYKNELEAITYEEKRFDRFVELNVIEQVFDLTKTSIIQNSWKARSQPYVHGWVYSIATGIIKDLQLSFNSATKIPEIYRIDSPVLS